MEVFRDYGERLEEYCKLVNYTLIADTMDYVVLETAEGHRFQCSGYSLHLAMVEANIK